jgi:hypothetical protein
LQKFELRLPEDCLKSGRNMWEEYYVYDMTLLYSFVRLLVSLLYLIAQCAVMDYLKLQITWKSRRGLTLQRNVTSSIIYV